MKRMLLLLLLMCSVSTWAQDVIVKRDGTAVVCRIINVSSLEIVYKKWTDLQGSNLVMSVADAASITYENGEKKVFDAPMQNTETNVTTPLQQVQGNYGQQTVSDNDLLKMAGKPIDPIKAKKKAKKLKITGYVGGGIMLATSAVLMVTLREIKRESGIDETLGFVSGGIVFGAGAVWATSFLVRGYKLDKQASQYAVQSAPVYQNDFQFKNGTSLSAGVDMLKDNARHNPTLGVGLTYNF